MNNLNKKEVIQAVVVADNFNDNFSPLTDEIPIALLPMVNVPLIDYTLESLNRSGVEEVFIFSCQFTDSLKSHLKKRIEEKCSWSFGMMVEVIASDGCRCFGDALRDLDAKGLIRGHFILMSADTVSNAQLVPILEKHKKTSQFDKGTTMTVVYKQTSTDSKQNYDLSIGMDQDSGRLLFHSRKKVHNKGDQIQLPLEIFLQNPAVVLHNDLVDPQIAICGPAALPLFADNFDFETRDDFIRGLLINEEILASTIYVSFLPPQQYAAKVENWKSYQVISNEVMNRWAYPLVPDMGICCLKQNYIFLRNFVYKNKDVQLASTSILKENIVINEDCSVSDNTIISDSVIGKKCKIGKDCKLNNAFILDNVVIEDGCILDYCVIGTSAKICSNTRINEGAVIGSNVITPKNSKISKHFVQSTPPDEYAKTIKLGEKAHTIQDVDVIEGSDSEDNYELRSRMEPLNKHYESSEYTSSSNDNSSRSESPVADDGKIFLSEVIDSLARGYEEKSNTEFLILEINSSRYAYNMTLDEVNYYVVKAVILLSIKKENVNILNSFNQLFNYLQPVLKNYIQNESAMRDCLKAFEDTANEHEILKSKIAQIIHYLYDKELVVEEAILSWYEELDKEETLWMRTVLHKLVTWLQQSSEEESEEEEE